MHTQLPTLLHLFSYEKKAHAFWEQRVFLHQHRLLMSRRVADFAPRVLILTRNAVDMPRYFRFCDK